MDKSITIATWLAKSRRQLEKHTKEPLSSLYAILANTLHQSKTWISSHPNKTLPLKVIQEIDQNVERVIAGEPLAYIIGHWDFFGFNFDVNPHVLIPRPETELLVEEAISWLKTHPSCRLAVDIGTGSGCIAISLAKYISNLQIIASDISFPALNTAQQNIHKHEMGARISLLCAHILQPIQGQFDLICANLPYIPTRTLESLDVRRHEPTQALDGSEDGLKIIHGLLKDVRRFLKEEGLVLLEIESNQGEKTLQYSKKYFSNTKINILKDPSGHDRLLRIENTQL